MTRQETAVERLSKLLHEYNDDKENLVRDVLSDLRHWADAYGLDFACEDKAAYHNYQYELADDWVANEKMKVEVLR